MRLVEFYQDDQDIYEDFVVSLPHSSFLQSWTWGEFQHKLGKKVWRIGVKQGNQLVAVAQILSHHLIIDKSYLYTPRGPLVMPGLDKQTQQQILEFILGKARDICYATKKENEIFLRLEPGLNFDQATILPLPLIQVPDFQPAHTQVINLQEEEKKLLKNMHSKTRYNIRLAKRKGVKVKRSNNPSDLKKFIRLNKVTAGRAGIKTWSDDYYKKLLTVLGQDNMAALWLAKYKGDILVANITVNYGDTMTYLYGASSNKHRNVMAPHLLQWQQMLWAKQNGYTYYDFWGVAPDDHPKADAWSGITRFKQGFAGEQLDYLGTYDYVYSAGWHKLYQLINKLK